MLWTELLFPHDPTRQGRILAGPYVENKNALHEGDAHSTRQLNRLNSRVGPEVKQCQTSRHTQTELSECVVKGSVSCWETVNVVNDTWSPGRCSRLSR